MARQHGPYASDRYVTPGVIIAFVLVGGIVVAVTVGAVTYLTAQEIDATPVVQLVGILIAAVTSCVQLILQLVGRTTATKTEASVGQLVPVVGAVADAVSATAPLRGYPPKLTENSNNG